MKTAFGKTCYIVCRQYCENHRSSWEFYLMLEFSVDQIYGSCSFSRNAHAWPTFIPVLTQNSHFRMFACCRSLTVNYYSCLSYRCAVQIAIFIMGVIFRTKLTFLLPIGYKGSFYRLYWRRKHGSWYDM